MGAKPAEPTIEAMIRSAGPGPSLDQRRFTSSELDARSLKEQAKLFRHGFIGERRILGLQRNRETRQRLGVPICR